MASIYKPKGKKNWYIGFIDPNTGKTRNISTGLAANKANKKKAEEMKTNIEKFLDESREKNETYEIKKATIQEAFNHMLRVNSDKALTTQKNYEWVWSVIIQHFNPNDPCGVLSKASVENWFIELRKNKPDWEKNTMHGILKVFRKFLNFLFEYSYIVPFKLNKDVIPKQETKQIIVFSRQHLNKIFSGMEEYDKTSNFKTMIYMLTYTGLRPTDIIDVKVEDIDLDECMMNYYSKKSKKYLRVPIHDDLVNVLLKRIDEIKKGRLLSYATISEMGKAFRRYLKKLSLDEYGYDLRTFRKTFATYAFEDDIPVTAVANLLGHKNIQTTLKYYTFANNKKLKSELLKMDFTKASMKNV